MTSFTLNADFDLNATIDIAEDFVVNSGTFTGNTSRIYVRGDFNMISGTFNSSSNATGFTLNGDFNKTGGVFNHNNGGIVMNGTAIQTIASNGSSLCELNISNTSAVVSLLEVLTVTKVVTIDAGAELNPATYNLSFGSGYLTDYALIISGILTAGSGSHTFGSARVLSTGTLNFTSGTTTINGYASFSGEYYLTFESGSTVNHNNGLIVFTYASASEYINSATDLTLNDVQVTGLVSFNYIAGKTLTLRELYGIGTFSFLDNCNLVANTIKRGDPTINRSRTSKILIKDTSTLKPYKSFNEIEIPVVIPLRDTSAKWVNYG